MELSIYTTTQTLVMFETHLLSGEVLLCAKKVRSDERLAWLQLNHEAIKTEEQDRPFPGPRCLLLSIQIYLRAELMLKWFLKLLFSFITVCNQLLLKFPISLYVHSRICHLLQLTNPAVISNCSNSSHCINLKDFKFFY